MGRPCRKTGVKNPHLSFGGAKHVTMPHIIRHVLLFSALRFSREKQGFALDTRQALSLLPFFQKTEKSRLKILTLFTALRGRAKK
jgi:hypothetical protein